MLQNHLLLRSYLLRHDKSGCEATTGRPRSLTCCASHKRTRHFEHLKHQPISKIPSFCWQPSVRYLKPVNGRPRLGGTSMAGRNVSDRRKAAFAYAELGNGPFITTSTTKTRKTPWSSLLRDRCRPILPYRRR